MRLVVACSDRYKLKRAATASGGARSRGTWQGIVPILTTVRVRVTVTVRGSIRAGVRVKVGVRENIKGNELYEKGYIM